MSIFYPSKEFVILIRSFYCKINLFTQGLDAGAEPRFQLHNEWKKLQNEVPATVVETVLAKKQAPELTLVSNENNAENMVKNTPLASSSLLSRKCTFFLFVSPHFFFLEILLSFSHIYSGSTRVAGLSISRGTSERLVCCLIERFH